MLDFVDFTKPMEFLKTLWDRSREFEVRSHVRSDGQTPPKKGMTRVSFLWSSIHLPSHGALCHAESWQHGLCRAETGVAGQFSVELRGGGNCRNPTVRCLWSMVPKTAAFKSLLRRVFSGWPLMIWWPLLRPANPAMQAFNMQFYLIWASGGQPFGEKWCRHCRPLSDTLLRCLFFLTLLARQNSIPMLFVLQFGTDGDSCFGFW